MKSSIIPEMTNLCNNVMEIKRIILLGERNHYPTSQRKLTCLNCHFPLIHLSTSFPLLRMLKSSFLKSINSSPAKTSSADNIPSSLIKAYPGVLAKLTAKLAKLSFQEGRFPTSFKHAAITRLLKTIFQ